jgi:hypothetical protein
VEPELVDQPEDAARLGGRGVLAGRIRPVLVGLAEAPQVGHHHVGAGQQRHDLAVVGPVPRPAVQQHHGRALPGSLVGQPEPVDRCLLAHPAYDTDG